MKNQSSSSLKAIIFIACLIFMAAAAGQASAQSIGWMSLGLTSSTGPALSGHGDGKLYIAAVNKQGAIFYRSTDSPTGWAAWQPVGSGAPVFAVDTAPVFVRDGNALYLFARGADNNIYLSLNSGSGWSSWLQLSTGGQVMGRFSAAFTRPGGSVNPEINLIFQSLAYTVKYMQFHANGTPTGVTRQWNNVLEGTIGTSGANDLWFAILSPYKLLIEKGTRTPFAVWVFHSVASRVPEGPEGGLSDVSNLVFLGDAIHVAYTIRYLDTASGRYAHAIEHARFHPWKPYDGYRRQIGAWEPGGLLPQSELCVYRNKLVAAYRNHQGYIYYARWDNADPAGPWVGRESVVGGLTSHRPVLAAYNRFMSNAPLDLSASNFGNDLFAAVNGYGDDALWVANFSRDIFRQELDRQFAIYTSNSIDCKNRSNPPAPTRISLFAEYRPVLGELGYNLWTLPNWFSGTLYKRAAEQACEAGTLGHTGWYDPPCAQVKSPVIIRPAGDIFVCASIWINQGNDYKNIFEELGHTSASALGFHDDHHIPTQAEADLTGIPLPALQDGYGLFGQRVRRCGGQMGRCRGFTGHAGNYDAGSRQHSFIYAAYYYFSDGDQLRLWAQQDLSAGDDLLKRKYDWIRQYIFRGVEFKKDNEPLASRPPCTYSLSSTSRSFGGGGGASSVSLLTQEGCNWTAKSNASWISITSSLSGSGSARINFSVTQNTTSANRTGTMTIAGQTVTVTQYRFVCVKCLPGSP